MFEKYVLAAVTALRYMVVDAGTVILGRRAIDRQYTASLYV